MRTPLARLMIAGWLSAVAAPALADRVPVDAMPANDPGTWVTRADYPAAELRARVTGTAGFRVAIDQQGAVTQCEIVHSSGAPALDAATCALVSQRARFVPATDQKGRPIAGSYTSRVRWLIPVSAQPPTDTARLANDPRDWVTMDDYPKAALRTNVQGTAMYRVAIDTTGMVAACNILESSGSKVLDDATCALIIKRARFIPATDPGGHPMTGSYTGHVRWVIPNTIYRAPAAGTVVERMMIEVDGKPAHCQAAGAEVGGSQLAYAPCPKVVYEPYRDAHGQPVRKLVTITSNTVITDAPN